VPQGELSQLLRDAGFNNPVEDATVTPIDDRFSMVRSLDIFTPLVDDGYIQGKIAASNVTSDIFAMNVLNVHGILAFLGVPTDMPLEIARDILRGMDDFAQSIGTRVLGGHTIHNAWPLSGGEAAGVGETAQIVFKQGLVPGDVLLLTKPLGTQPLLAAYRIFAEEDDVLSDLDKGVIRQGIDQAITCMTTPNKTAVEAIHACGGDPPVRAMTDVTGFGLWGVLKEMVEQSVGATAIVDTVVTLPQALEVAEYLGYNTEQGKSSETAGGLLMAVKPDRLEELQSALAEFRVPHWQVGHVASGESEVRLAANVEKLVVEYTGTL
jgi:selenide,water dikinase